MIVNPPGRERRRYDRASLLRLKRAGADDACLVRARTMLLLGRGCPGDTPQQIVTAKAFEKAGLAIVESAWRGQLPPLIRPDFPVPPAARNHDATVRNG